MKPFDPAGFVDRLSFTIRQAINRQRMVKQEELAARLAELSGVEIKQSAISRWTTGSRPSFEHLVALADLAAVDPGWLAVGGLSEAPAPPAYLPPREVKVARDRKGPPTRGGEKRKRA
jgi:transcriptional regulator with XRE-family HTH domain